MPHSAPYDSPKGNLNRNCCRKILRFQWRNLCHCMHKWMNSKLITPPTKSLQVQYVKVGRLVAYVGAPHPARYIVSTRPTHTQSYSPGCWEATLGLTISSSNLSDRIRSFHVWPEFSPCTCHGVNAIRITSANTARWWKALLTELQRNPCVS